MAIGVDLNQAPVEGHGAAFVDLNEEPPDEEEHQVPDGRHRGGKQDFFPFDLNVDEPGGHEHLEEDDAHIMDAELPIDLNAMAEDMQDYGVYADAVDVVFEEAELSDSEDEEHVDENANQENQANLANRKKNLTARERQEIYEALLERSTRGKLRRNITSVVAERFNVNLRAVQRIWQRAKQCRDQGVPVDVSSKKPKNCGKKRVVIDLSTMVRNVPLQKRSTIRKLAKKIGVPRSSLHRWFKQGMLRRHSNAIKPYLREENKKERLRWCTKMLDPSTLPHDPKFIEMDNIIHIDEKWFNATKKSRNFYMLPDEEDPHRTVQNKNSIDKVMILSAVAKPRHDGQGNETFSGKIGVWPFVRKEPAKRKSRNRARGTLVTKTINVDRDTIRSYLISKVLPAIKACWPREDANRIIWIQQDNARTHIPVDDEQFAIATSQAGLNIKLMNQPPNSPDMNCLDLGFFASLQSYTYDNDSRNLDELIANVLKEFQDYDSTLLNRVFLTLQGCLIEVMKAGGGNKYSIPHMNKERLEALGTLPRRLSCDRDLYQAVIESLSN